MDSERAHLSGVSWFWIRISVEGKCTWVSLITIFHRHLPIIQRIGKKHTSHHSIILCILYFGPPINAPVHGQCNLPLQFNPCILDNLEISSSPTSTNTNQTLVSGNSLKYTYTNEAG